jgi:putative two-component system response regulator
MEILIVDDSPVALELLRHVLTQHGYTVRTAVDGQEALKSLDAHECQMVITDWEMPRMNGVELCRSIRQSGSSSYVYTILLTSRNQSADTVEGLTAGADDFIAKPFQPAELLARVRVGERILQLETRDLTIFALAKLAESRDSDTGAHLERVRNYSKILAQYLSTQPDFREQVNAEFVRLIYLTSPLHDIGKVAIPDAVLLKPGRLNAVEFEVMKTHALHGAATLEAALAEYPRAKYLQMARDIAASHHEKFGGGGYPRGLRGTEIPLSARIVSVADVYDALTSKRVYKAAFSHERARGIILEGSGTDFDPAIVQAFLACEDRFQEIQQLFAEELPQSEYETAEPGVSQLATPQVVSVT